jgi:hypothetical protein
MTGCRSACMMRIQDSTGCGLVADTLNIDMSHLKVKLEGLLTKVDSNILILAAQHQQKKNNSYHIHRQTRVTRRLMSA